MNHKNPIGLMAAVAATAVVCGCASAPGPQHTANARQEPGRELGVTRKAWEQCIRAAIPRVDNPQSSSDVASSEVVARAAMKDCSDENTDMVRVLAHTLAPHCGQDPQCTRGALAMAQREAMRAATEEVVNARVRAAGTAALQCN